jgi:hypothetical protein
MVSGHLHVPARELHAHPLQHDRAVLLRPAPGVDGSGPGTSSGMYLLAGLAGALLSFAFEPRAAIVGASGAVFGVLYGFAHYWPHERIYIWASCRSVPGHGHRAGRHLHLLRVHRRGRRDRPFRPPGRVRRRMALPEGPGAPLRSAFRRKATPGAEPTAVERISGKAARDEKRGRSIRVDALHEINRQEVERIQAKIAKGAGQPHPDERAFMNRMVD